MTCSSDQRLEFIFNSISMTVIGAVMLIAADIQTRLSIHAI